MVLFLRQENNHYKVAKDFLGTISEVHLTYYCSRFLSWFEA